MLDRDIIALRATAHLMRMTAPLRAALMGHVTGVGLVWVREGAAAMSAYA